MALADTAPEIRRRQLDVYRAMNPQQRVNLALSMSEDIRRVTEDGIRSRNPGFDKAEVRQAWLRVLHGPRLAGILPAAPPAP